jgi:uncharacterized membrane protein
VITRAKLNPLSGEVNDKSFCATTPNPTSGFFVMMPKKDVFELNMTVEEAFKIVIFCRRCDT